MFKSVGDVGKVVGLEGVDGAWAVAENKRRDFPSSHVTPESGKVTGQEFRLLLFPLVAQEVRGPFELGDEFFGGAGGGKGGGPGIPVQHRQGLVQEEVQNVAGKMRVS